MDPCKPYIWASSEWSPCSASCGEGLETRELVCMDTKGNSAVSESRCAALVRPSTSLTRECTMTPCMTYMWRISGWTKCSATCDGGKMTRTLSCFSSVRGEQVEERFCNQLLRPSSPLELVCNGQPCVTYAWDCTEWSACSATCGYGQHQRKCSCQGSDLKIYRDEMCPEARCTTRSTEDCGKFAGSMTGGAGAKPAEFESCSTGKICMDYTYSVSPWCTKDPEPCNQRKVLYERSATCIGPSGIPVDEQLCAAQAIRPKTEYNCDADEIAQEMYNERCAPSTEAPTSLAPTPPTAFPTAVPSAVPSSLCNADDTQKLSTLGRNQLRGQALDGFFDSLSATCRQCVRVNLANLAKCT